MTSSASFLNRLLGTLLVLLCLTGCAGVKAAPGTAAAEGGLVRTLAVLPIDNLSGSGSAPLQQIRRDLLARLREAGFTLLDEARLDDFMERHRIRWMGGVSGADARAFLDETGVQGVMICNLTLYSPLTPPKIGLYCRVVSSGEHPEILWMDGVGMAGDDHPGILDLGQITNPEELAGNALDFLVDSLTARMSGEPAPPQPEPYKIFEPKVMYNAMSLGKGERYSVAVVPFGNASDRPHAGEVMALHLLSALVGRGDFQVIEPGLLRDKLLDLRIVMEQGLSLQDLFLVHKKLGSDLLLSGRVNRYEDPSVPRSIPSVDFSLLLMQGEGKRVIWASNSFNKGGERVHFFDIGRISTAFELSDQMVRSLMTEADRRSENRREAPPETDIFKWILEGNPMR